MRANTPLIQFLASVLVTVALAWLPIRDAAASPPATGCTHFWETEVLAQSLNECSDIGFAVDALSKVTATGTQAQNRCANTSYPIPTGEISAVSQLGSYTWQRGVKCKNSAGVALTSWQYLKASYPGVGCTARNADLGGAANPLKAAATQSKCIAGCTFAIVDQHSTRHVRVSAPGQPEVEAGLLHVGIWEYTGDTCMVTPSDPRTEEKPKTECTPAASGQTFCIRPDGKECYTASTGRAICWNPGERGEKPDGPTLGKNQNGKNPSIPDSIPPLNEHWEQGPSTNVETTRPGTGPTTYNVNTNYTTSGRGPAGNNNTGTQTDGSGKPIGTSGTGGQDGDGDDTASGGGNCETPPVTSGDPILGMVAKQTWATRCAVDAGNAAKVTGNIGDCTQPFTVEGDNANAVKLRAMRAQLCPNVGEPGDPGAGESEADRRGLQEVEVDGSELDQAGWLGGGSCPALATGGGGQMSRGFAAFLASPPPIWCQYISWIRAVFIALATITAIYILKAD